MSLKRLLDANDGGVWGEDFDTDGVPVLRSTDMSIDGRWQLTDPAVRRLSPSEIASSRLLRYDIVITKSSGSQLHLGKSAIVTPEVEATGACFSNFMQRIRANASLYPKYLWWLLNSEFAREQLFFNGSTTTGLVNLSGKIIGNTVVTKPTLDEQRVIAAFLDRETARIDALVAKKQRLIELLEEKRQSIISNAVTKGLNPAVEKIESGIEWFGKIPKSWKVTRLGWACETINDINHEMPDAVSEGIPFLSAKDLLNDGSLNFTENIKFISEEDFMRLSKKILPQRDDIIYSRIGACLGKARLVETDAPFSHIFLGS